MHHKHTDTHTHIIVRLFNPKLFLLLTRTHLQGAHQPECSLSLTVPHPSWFLPLFLLLLIIIIIIGCDDEYGYDGCHLSGMECDGWTLYLPNPFRVSLYKPTYLPVILLDHFVDPHSSSSSSSSSIVIITEERSWRQTTMPSQVLEPLIL